MLLCRRGVDLVNDALLCQCSGLTPKPEALLPPPTIAAAPGTELGSTQPRVNDADPDPALAFNLSSRPSAVNKIWLDFQGSSIQNTAWNTALNRSIITVPAFDFSGNATDFTTVERQV
jgi:hypothetical protein